MLSTAADPGPGQWSLEGLVGTGDQDPSSLLCSKAPPGTLFLEPDALTTLHNRFAHSESFNEKKSKPSVSFPPPNSTLDHNLTARLLLFLPFIRQRVQPALLKLLRAAPLQPSPSSRCFLL